MSSAPARWVATSLRGARSAACVSRSAMSTIKRWPRHRRRRRTPATRSICRTSTSRDALDRLVPDPNGHGVAAADLVIEAVPEDPQLKRKIYAESVEPRMKAGAILASNTSSLRAGRPGRRLKRSGAFRRTALLQPGGEDGTGRGGRPRPVRPGRAATALCFTAEIDRLPSPVQQRAGLPRQPRADAVSARGLVAGRRRACRKKSSTARPKVSACRWARSRSPTRSASMSAWRSPNTCAGTSTSRCPRFPRWLRRKVEAGEFGRKTGRGLYDWKDGQAHKGDAGDEGATDTPDLEDRLILPMLDACVACLRQGVVADEAFVDGAMIFATGFAPFSGGPMHYARQRGVHGHRRQAARPGRSARRALRAGPRLVAARRRVRLSGCGGAHVRRRRRDRAPHRRTHGGQDPAGPAARARQGEHDRQCADARRAARPFDRAAHLHRADAGAAGTA